MVRQVPNILTFGRLVLAVVFLVMVLYSPSAGEHRTLLLDISFVIFVVAGLTDIIDGPIARRLDVASRFGRMLDPLVDKVLICGGFICLAIIGEPKLFAWSALSLGVIQWSVAVIIAAREAFVTVLRHVAEARGVNFAATWAGKVKMFVQSFAIGTVLVKTAHVQTAAWGQWFTSATLIIAVVVTVVSAWSAIQRGKKI